jgi:hypothetical protein
MYKLGGEWALVTGATSGIGLEMAKILAAKGMNLVLVSRNEDKLCEVARQLNEDSDIIIMPVDLSVTGSAVVLFNECDRLGLNITVLINNAGFGKFGESLSMNSPDVESMLTLNMTTLTSLSNLFGRKMKERRSGYILNVASTAGYFPMPYFSAYSSSKAYVRYFTQALREEMKDHGVRVSCLLPGATNTNFFDVAFDSKPSALLRWQRMMCPRKVARAGLEGMFKGRREVVPGAMNKMISRISVLVPHSLVSRLMKKSLTLRSA